MVTLRHKMLQKLRAPMYVRTAAAISRTDNIACDMQSWYAHNSDEHFWRSSIWHTTQCMQFRPKKYKDIIHSLWFWDCLRTRWRRANSGLAQVLREAHHFSRRKADRASATGTVIPTKESQAHITILLNLRNSALAWNCLSNPEMWVSMLCEMLSPRFSC